MIKNVLGRSVDNEALRAAYNLAGKSGKKEDIEASDLKDAKIVINGKKRSFNYNTVRKNADYGLSGNIVTRDEFAIRLQEIANNTKKEVTVILKNGKKIIIKPLVQPKVFKAPENPIVNAPKLTFSALVSTLTRSPIDTPNLLHDHIVNNNYGYTNNDDYLEPEALYNKGKGDCNDFAIFSHYFLSKAGYKPRFFHVIWPQILKPGKLPEGHDICVYKDKNTGLYNFFDQYGRNKVGTTNLFDVFFAARNDWDYTIELTVSNGQVYAGTEKTNFRYGK